MTLYRRDQWAEAFRNGTSVDDALDHALGVMKRSVAVLHPKREWLAQLEKFR